MKEPNQSFSFHPRLIWGLVVFTVIYRIIVATNFPALSNSSPTMALCFGGGLLLGARFWWVPAILVVVSDFLLGLFISGSGFGAYTVFTIVAFSGAAWLGGRFSRWSGRTWPALWCGALLCSVGFYVAANTFAWAAYPGYAKTLAGWWQSQTTGLPQYSPQSWVFLRNALIGDSIWCALAGLLFFCQRFFGLESSKKVQSLA